MRKPVMAGNWKMNKTPGEAAALAKEILPLAENASCEIVLCVPAVNFHSVYPIIHNSKIGLGAQNVHYAQSGAFTGEVSAAMLAECGVRYVIIGHSERRNMAGETDAVINLKTKAAINAGLIPIICVGETLDDRQAGYTNTLIEYQAVMALTGLTETDVARLIIAYEPVWAIGTGVVASDEQANDAIGVIRSAVGKKFGRDTAGQMRILYGGSMKPDNVSGLMRQPEIDGGLIGGASLTAAGFSALIHFGEIPS